MNVLIVDDSETCQRLSEEFEKLDIECATAVDFANAIMHYNRKKPDAIICEIPLPQSCGFELAAYVRSRDELTPILFHTHLLDTRAINLAMWLGGDAYLKKPTAFERLTEAISDVVSSKRNQRRKPVDVDGLVYFRCNCGEELNIKPDYLGKSIVCHKCRRHVYSPNPGYIVEGHWITSNVKTGRDLENPGFRCRSCSRYLNPLQTNRSDECQCATCEEFTKLPDWVNRRKKLFIKYLEHDNDDRHEAKPNSSLIQLKCPKCRTFYQYDVESKTQTVCSFCQTKYTTNSLKNSPLARVQLLASGRYGMIKKCPANPQLVRKSFLIPRGKQISIGDSSSCQIRIPDPQIHDAQCHVMYDDEERLHCQPNNGSQVTVNGQALDGPVVLKGKSDISFGSSTISLYALGQSSHDNRIRKGIKEYFRFSEDQFHGHNALLVESACILYDYWSKQ